MLHMKSVLKGVSFEHPMNARSSFPHAFNARQLKALGLSMHEFYIIFSTQELKDAGFNSHERKDAGFMA
eukprot:7036728-Karenia_brevis.AAC.1